MAQEQEYQVDVKLVKGREFTERDELSFIQALEARLGKAMGVNLEYVSEIPREKSGKFRIVKNFLVQSKVAMK